tara:strand:- start:299 stop:490 length:192 start_codon:yes stop_codon:yes gene_type:complete
MDFSKEDLQKILDLRKDLVITHEKLRDYKSNKNAIMREIDHVAVLEESIRKLDNFLSKYVLFS